jgi:hypothetical protein
LPLIDKNRRIRRQRGQHKKVLWHGDGEHAWRLPVRVVDANHPEQVIRKERRGAFDLATVRLDHRGSSDFALDYLYCRPIPFDEITTFLENCEPQG